MTTEREAMAEVRSYKPLMGDSREELRLRIDLLIGALETAARMPNSATTRTVEQCKRDVYSAADAAISKIDAAQAASAQPQWRAYEDTRRVYLVATGETHEGQETYTRHEDAQPPLSDAELLYAWIPFASERTAAHPEQGPQSPAPTAVQSAQPEPVMYQRQFFLGNPDVIEPFWDEWQECSKEQYEQALAAPDQQGRALCDCTITTAAQAAMPVAHGEQEAFEAWAHANAFNIHRDESDKYKNYHRATTRFARDGWLSALAWVKNTDSVARSLREAIDRTWHVLKKHGKHPGRTDDTLWDCVDAALTTAHPTPQEPTAQASPAVAVMAELLTLKPHDAGRGRSNEGRWVTLNVPRALYDRLLAAAPQPSPAEAQGSGGE
jgi:hypothetical protein